MRLVETLIMLCLIVNQSARSRTFQCDNATPFFWQFLQTVEVLEFSHLTSVVIPEFWFGDANCVIVKFLLHSNVEFALQVVIEMQILSFPYLPSQPIHALICRP